MTALDTTTTGPATASVPIKPSDIARRKADVELLRGLQDFGKEIKIGDRRSA